MAFYSNNNYNSYCPGNYIGNCLGIVAWHKKSEFREGLTASIRFADCGLYYIYSMLEANYGKESYCNN